MSDRKLKKDKPAGVKEKVIRLLEIYTLISQKQYPSITFLTERYGVTRRTVHRYLEIINMVDPIELDRERGGYKFSNHERIKKLILNDNEIMYLLALSGLSTELGNMFKESFDAFLSKLVNITDYSRNKARVPMIIKIPEVVKTEKLTTYFKAIEHCIHDRRSVDITYKTLYSGETSERRVDPYGFIYHEGAWLVVGYCHMRNEIRKFALDRILDLKETQFLFVLPEDFDTQKYLEPSWGVFDEKDKVTVIVRFTPKIADYITRKDRWHPSEKRRVLSTGEVELSFTVAGVREIKRWIYQWLPDVEVIEPEWFREQINKELAESSQKHR